jgi:CheY-like chemotaxis protein
MDPKKLERLKTLSLLYVEDDAATRDELAQILEVWLGEVHVAGNGQEGLDAFLRVHPDMVLTDIQMPVLNGLSMSAEIRRIVPRQPIIVLSAYNDVEFLFRAIELGISQYITKPVNVELPARKNWPRLPRPCWRNRSNSATGDCLSNTVTWSTPAPSSASSTRRAVSPMSTIAFVNSAATTSRTLIGSDIHGACAIRRAEGYFRPKSGNRSWMATNGRASSRTRPAPAAMYVVESSLVPIVNEHNQVEEIVCLDVDITDIYLNYENMLESLSRSEQSLQRATPFSRRIQTRAGTGRQHPRRRPRADASSAPTFVWPSMLGYEIKELCERPLSDIVPECDYSTCFQRSTREIDGHCSQVIPFIHQNGAERYSVSSSCRCA